MHGSSQFSSCVCVCFRPCPVVSGCRMGFSVRSKVSERRVLVWLGPARRRRAPGTAYRELRRCMSLEQMERSDEVLLLYKERIACLVCGVGQLHGGRSP